MNSQMQLRDCVSVYSSISYHSSFLEVVKSGAVRLVVVNPDQDSQDGMDGSPETLKDVHRHTNPQAQSVVDWQIDTAYNNVQAHRRT